jgi:HEAT repeat protein
VRRLKDLMGIRDGEGARTCRLLAFIFLVTAAVVLSKSAQRDIFLTAFPRTRIPDAFLGSALVSCALSMAISATAGRFGTAQLMQVLLWASALTFSFIPSTGAMGIFIAVEALTTALLVQGWGLTAEVLDVRSAKRLLPIVGLGAGLAWTFGGFWVGAAARMWGSELLLQLCPWLLIAAFLLLGAIVRRDMVAPRSAGRHSESAWQSMMGGLRYVLEEPLMKVLAAIITLELLVERILDFQLLSAVQAHLGGTPGAVASFMGLFYGATGAVTLVAPFILSGAVLTRWGSARTILGSQLYVLGVSVLFLLLPMFSLVVALCAGDRILKQSLAAPARSQVFGAIPSVRRAQAGALLRGVLAAVFSALGAVALKLVAPYLTVQALSVPASVMTLAAAIITSRALQKAYVSALQRSIDRRKLDFDEQSTRLGELDREQVALLREELQSSDEDRAIFACSLLEKCPSPLSRPLLHEALHHPHDVVRTCAAEMLGRLADPRDRSFLWKVLQNTRTPQLRRACLRALILSDMPLPPEGPLLLQDDDLKLRALARTWKIQSDGETELLERMLRSTIADERFAAAWAVGEVPLGIKAPATAFLPLLSDPSLVVRRTALASAGQFEDAGIVRALVFALEEPATASAAFEAFSHLPEGAIVHVGSALSQAPPPIVSRAATALSSVHSPRATQLLHQLLDHADEQVRYRASRAIVLRRRTHPEIRPAEELVLRSLTRELERGSAYQTALRILNRWHSSESAPGDPEHQFVLHELEARIQESERRILALLAVISDPKLGRLSQYLHDASTHMVARVLELLEQSLDEHLASLVLPFFERGASASEESSVPLGKDPITAILDLNDAHLRRCALLAYRDTLTQRDPELFLREEPLLHLVERTRFLRSVPLFRHLSPDDLMKLAEIAEAREYRRRETIFRKGDIGDVLYVVVRGRVEIQDQGQIIATQATHDFFGELALFDQEPRSANAVCTEDSELLQIGGADLEALMERRPEISREILRVLARRLRRTTEAMVGKTSTSSKQLSA